MIPIQFGTREQFSVVKALLGEANYTEAAICERLHFRAIWECLRDPQPWEPPSRDVLDLLIRLFLRGEFVSDGEIHSALSSPGLSAMAALGLLAKDASKPECSYSPVALYPSQALFIASDRWVPVGSPPEPRPHDVVYPAITPETLNFLRSLPQDPCEDFLDLCSGTGIAALTAATRYARHVWAFDVTERATRFAEFNRLLNGVPNGTTARGDVYEPAGSLTFDRIVAHPPYVPVLKPTWLYHAGGEDGEQVTRRIVEGLPRYLRPGGRLYAVALGTDREGEPFERRIRGWLGRDESEFDMLLVVWRNIEPTTFAAHSEDAQAWRTVFRKLKVENLAQGSIVIRRKDRSNPPFTMRCERGTQDGPEETEWLLKWSVAAAGLEIIPILLESRPALSARLELNVLHRMVEGELSPSVYTIEVDHPFRSRRQVPPWVACLLARCDGKLTAREHLDYFRDLGVFQAEDPVKEFAGLLHTLVSRGFIEIEGFRPPALQR